MAKITFKNPLDKQIEFTEVYDVSDLLIPIVYKYARESDDEIYNAVLNQKVSLYVNGQNIETDSWTDYVISDSDEIVIMPKVGSDAAGWVMVALGVILIGLAIWNPLFLTPAIEFLGGAGTVALAGAALALSGLSMLLFAPDMPNLPSMRGLEQSQTYSWGGIQTMARVGVPIPVVYGTHAVGGNIISGFTHREGADDYLHLLLALSEGKIAGIAQKEDYSKSCTTSDTSATNYKVPAILIDDQSIDIYEDVEWWYRKGVNAASPARGEFNPNYQNVIPYFSGATSQITDGRQIDSDGVVYTTSKEVDRVNIQLKAPTLYITNEGGIWGNIVYFGVQYRATGTSTWYNYEIRTWNPYVYSGKGINVQYTSGTTKEQYASPANPIKIRIIDAYSTNLLDREWGRISPERAKNQYNCWAVWGRTDCLRNINGQLWQPNWHDGNGSGNKLYKIIFDVQDTVTNFTTRIVAGVWLSFLQQQRKVAYTDAWGSTSYKWETYYTEKVSPQWLTWGPYRFMFGAGDDGHQIVKLAPGDEIEIRNTYSSTNYYNISGTTKTGLWKSIPINFNDNRSGMSGAGRYDLKIYRQGERTTSIRDEDNLILDSISETLDGEFIYPNTALLGLRIRASEQLSGGVPNITTVVRGVEIDSPDTRLAASPSATIPFEDVYYAKSTDSWERTSDASAVTWDEQTYVKQWSNNPMLVTRDLLLHTRYGLGDYVGEADLYQDSLITTIKECHATYVPDNKDLLGWWDDGDSHTFDSNITIRTDHVATSTYVDSANEKIVLANANIQTIDLKLNNPMDRYAGYYLSCTATALDTNVDWRLYIWTGHGWRYISQFAPNVGNGTVNCLFGTYTTQHTKIRLVIDSHNSDSRFSGEITDVSLNPYGNKETLHFHKWDGVFDRQQAAMSVLLETCDSFRTWPTWFGGKFGFIYDKDEDPVHTISVGNCIEFAQSWTPLSDIPYRIIGQYTDETKDWEMNQLIAQQTSTADLIKVNEVVLGLKGVTSRKRAERETKFKLNKITNMTHIVQIKAGMDSIHATAGDIVFVQDDLPSWGTGGRILDYDATQLEITLDKTVTIASPSGNDYVVRYQTADNSTVTASLDASSLSPNETIQAINVKSWPAQNPIQDAVFAFGDVTSYTKKFRIVSAVRTAEDTVDLSCIEHIDSLYTPDRDVSVIHDVQSELPPPLARPLPPIDPFVTAVSPDRGRGFILSARKDPDDTSGVVDILIRWKRTTDSNSSFTDLGTITPTQGVYEYLNNSILPGTNYTFRFIARTTTKSSTPTDIEFEYPLYTEPDVSNPGSDEMGDLAVTGIRVKGANANATYFDGKDLSLEWNALKIPGGVQDELKGYRLEMYYAASLRGIMASHLLREADVKNNYFTYTYDMMLEDSGGKVYGMTATPLIAVIYGVLPSDQLTTPSMPFRIHNRRPSPISNLIAKSTTTGVNFVWDTSSDNDHMVYEYKIKVATNPVWGTIKSIDTNNYFYSLTATDIVNYSDSADVYIRVRDMDWHLQRSATFIMTSGSSRAVELADAYFFITATMEATSGMYGFPASLYDGDLDSGGVTIT